MLKVKQKLNSKSRRKPKVSGHRNGYIYSPVYRDFDGNEFQYVRRMPQQYCDAKTEEQLTERNDMQRVMQLHHILKDCYQDCFEGKGKSYTRFISANRNAEAGQIVISRGSLPTLHCSILGKEVEFDFVEEDWQPGDIIRQIRTTIDGKEYFALIHMRQTENGWLCSSQDLVEIVPEIPEPINEPISASEPISANLSNIDLLYLSWLMLTTVLNPNNHYEQTHVP